jgi:signal transduction histidine kinase
VIAVEDDGPGVPAELRAKIFEAFYRGPGSGRTPGSGIGLSLVARFAEMHGGRARVREPEGGARPFRVLLPDASG